MRASSGADVALDGIVTKTMGEDLPQAMARVARTVETALDNLLPEVEGAEARLVEAMRYATLGGGKRMRAFLVMESAGLFAVAETCAARVAAAVEMLHAYSLVHDDLPAMDDDDLRRGKPSTHKAFDEATAILAGDALQTRAFEVLAEPDTHSDPQARCELVQALASASGARGMAGGQMIDMLAEGQTLDGPAITRLQALKTGRLIQFSAEAGAMLGRAPFPQRHLLAAYGRDLGAAFQIADDLLDAKAARRKPARPPGRMLPPARRPWWRSSDLTAPGRTPSCWPNRPPGIWRASEKGPICCVHWLAFAVIRRS